MNKLRTLIVMAALVVSGVAMAQDKPYLTAEDVTIGEDRTGVLKISMVSDEYKVIGSGSCGKGYKEWVLVSDGGPYLKARAKLG